LSFVNYTVTETEKGIFDSILHGDMDLESDPWPSISESAKDLLRKMLTKDPKKRITAAEALGNGYKTHSNLRINLPRIVYFIVFTIEVSSVHSNGPAQSLMKN
jgi:serine/threonine protein kinase